MRYFSMFSGIGGFEEGIRRVDEKAKCVGFSEVDKYAIKVYQSHFPGHKNYGDATRIVPSELPDFDVLVGGFPCQAFSIAGTRLGFEDTRGTLFFDIARILREKKPRLFVLENVKGLLSHDNGRTFKTIITTLVELGYSVEWQVLNSKNHGVPQNRERVFIIGHLGGFGGREVFPIGTRNSDDVEKRRIIQINKPNHAGYRKYSEKGISPNLRARDRGDEHSTPRIEIGTRIRRLTPVECERLQGFPDGWTAVVSDSQRYKCLGNAVTVNVISAIFKRLANHKEGMWK